MRLLGIDFGEKNIGLAVSDDQGMMAFPHSVIPNSKEALSTIEGIVRKERIGKIVMGESFDYKGNPNPIMLLARPFALALSKKGFDVSFESELLSSHQAAHIQGKTAMIDAAAASIILQSFIDRNKQS